jgi:hypothetical protein
MSPCTRSATGCVTMACAYWGGDRGSERSTEGG